MNSWGRFSSIAVVGIMRCLSTPGCLGAGLLAWAASILLTAFVIICVHTGTAWPWTHVVHEDGRRTLIETILYFDHATRELPLDVILGVAIGGCVFFAFPPAPDDQGAERAGSTRRVLTLALMTVVILAVILVGTAAKGGIGLVFDELLQNRTRFGVPLEFGSHWRYHLLERIAMILGSVGIAGALRMLSDEQRAVNAQRDLRPCHRSQFNWHLHRPYHHVFTRILVLRAGAAFS